MKYKKAPKWKFLLARIFGKRQVHFDTNVIIVTYYFRGSMYITEVRYID